MPNFTYQTQIFAHTDHEICKDDFDKFVTNAMNTPGVQIEIISSNMFYAPDPGNNDTTTFFIYLLYKETIFSAVHAY